jgi:hypothetical protein
LAGKIVNSKAPQIVIKNDPTTKPKKPTTVIKMYLAVNGRKPLFLRFKTNQLNNNGCAIKEIKTTHNMPISVIKAIDCNAGCLANTITPIPIIVTKADKRIDDLKEFNVFLPNLYSLSNPSMIKIL